MWTLIALLLLTAVGFNLFCLVREIMQPSFFPFVRLVYNFNTLLLPLLLFITGAMAQAVWIKTQSDFSLFRTGLLFMAAAVLLVLLRVYATHIEPHWLKVERVEIRTSKVTKPVKIMHISDIQSPRIGKYEERVFRIIKELEPDLVLCTGDHIQPLLYPDTSYKSELTKLGPLFESLNAPLGIYTVEGDTDRHLARFAPDLLKNVKLLQSDGVKVDGTPQLSILGLTLNQSHNGASSRIKQWIEETSADDFRIVIGHGPNYMLDILDQPIDLCLAGHTHGGQVCIPFYGAPVTNSRLPHNKAKGFRREGRFYSNVSAGIGCEHYARLPNIRFFCRPAITLITLIPEHQEDNTDKTS
jgi:uncharacterized protein